MSQRHDTRSEAIDAFRHASSYDRSINWEARFGRELPVLSDVFGPPGDGGLIDAGCGPGRHAVAMAERGYRVVGVDASAEMLEVARAHGRGQDRARFLEGLYEALPALVGTDHDGLFCLANSLAAAGTRDAVNTAIEQFAACLRPGGRLFVQVLNFTRMRNESPCIRGPRVVTVDGVEYVSVRQFHFDEAGVLVSNVTLWHEDGWKQASTQGRLYPVERAELMSICDSAGFDVDATWGDYKQSAFDFASSIDLIVVATRRGR